MKDLNEHLNEALERVDEGFMEAAEMFIVVSWCTWWGIKAIKALLKTKPAQSIIMKIVRKIYDVIGAKMLHKSLAEGSLDIDARTMKILEMLCNRVLKANYFGDEGFRSEWDESATPADFAHASAILINAMMDLDRSQEETKSIITIINSMFKSKYANQIRPQDKKDLQEFRTRLMIELKNPA